MRLDLKDMFQVLNSLLKGFHGLEVIKIPDMMTEDNLARLGQGKGILNMCANRKGGALSRETKLKRPGQVTRALRIG